MADVKKMATRDGYGKGLVALGAEHPDLVVLDADLAGSTKTGMFAKAYPDRHFNCGIAEGNMMSVAAGLAASGMVPFASSFAMFAYCGSWSAGTPSCIRKASAAWFIMVMISSSAAVSIPVATRVAIPWEKIMVFCKYRATFSSGMCK